MVPTQRNAHGLGDLGVRPRRDRRLLERASGFKRSASRLCVVANPESDETRLLERAATGDQAILKELLDAHEERLSRMIAFRIDSRISGRVDVSDVIQEVRIEVWRHLRAYLQGQPVPFYLWLRGVAANKLREIHRRHLGTQMRDARREVPLDNYFQGPSSAAIVAQLIDTISSISGVLIRDEVKAKLRAAVEGLEPLDREILALRHFEQLTPAEAADVLKVSHKAAGMRYLRALKRLKEALGELPGGLAELRL